MIGEMQLHIVEPENKFKLPTGKKRHSTSKQANTTQL